jgi:hypothetical protein
VFSSTLTVIIAWHSAASSSGVEFLLMHVCMDYEPTLRCLECWDVAEKFTLRLSRLVASMMYRAKFASM